MAKAVEGKKDKDTIEINKKMIRNDFARIFYKLYQIFYKKTREELSGG